MDFIARCFQTFLEQWFIPIVIDILVGIVLWKLQSGQSPRQIITKMIKVFPIIAIVSTIIVTIISGSGKPEERGSVTVSDVSFDSGIRGEASLYNDELMPMWFESDLDDICLSFMIDNTGTSYANIKKAKLIVDDFSPITADDILVCSEEHHAGMPAIASANIDLSNIPKGKSEYDVIFSSYSEDEETFIPLKQGQTFNVKQSSQTQLSTFLDLEKSGVYTYHVLVDYEYYNNKCSMETAPVSFIYIAGNSEDYRFDKEKLKTIHFDRFFKDEDKPPIYYTIDGRTLRIYNTETISSYNDFLVFGSLINTIIVEDGTKTIEIFAFGEEDGLYNVKTMYLPKSLEFIDFDCFHYFNEGNLERIFYGGTQDDWNHLVQKSDSTWPDDIESVEIKVDCDLPTFEEELKNIQDENEEKLYVIEENDIDNESTAIITGEGKKSGICSASPHDNVKWELTGADEDMTLTITGNGAMASFDDSCEGPWGERRREITRIIIENGVTSIGNYAFIDFENLTNVSIANSVKSIGNIAFWGCWSLDSVDIPKSVEDIGESAFAYCYSLNNITLSDSVINIGDWAFDYCYNITNISIPNSVKKIGSNAFFACEGLKLIYFEGTAPVFGEEAFSGVDAIVYYPQNDSSWSDSVKQQYGGVIEWSPWNP